MGRKKQHIDRENNRYGLFMNENSFDLEIMYGRHYLEQDVNFIIKLYRINIIESKTHKLYGEAKPIDKKYFSPVELNVMIDVDDNQQFFYGEEQGLTREDSGNLVIGIYLKELEEKRTEINRGDIIEYNFSGDKPRYFEVENANNVTDHTSQTIANMLPYWKRITAIPIKEDITRFLNQDSLT